ncbi:DUF768 domain-containing protein [Mesorhizobium sp. ASY16-5R]|uniref:DUF768 domain-containing protein n=1 Tax=Mesorhizobium sp. ASY16-5R TaxID=3445772 RepID=UPI003F9F1C60
MSKRGRKFLNDWLSEHIPIDAEPDSVLASELADRLLVDAEAAGMTEDDIDEEVDSVFEAALRSIKKHKRKKKGG